MKKCAGDEVETEKNKKTTLGSGLKYGGKQVQKNIN